MPALNGETVALMTGLSHTCTLMLNKPLLCWGTNTSGQVDWQHLAGGSTGTGRGREEGERAEGGGECAVSARGSEESSRGSTDSSLLNNKSTSKTENKTPSPKINPTPSPNSDYLTTWSSLIKTGTAGYTHTVIQHLDHLLCFGSNQFHQCDLPHGYLKRGGNKVHLLDSGAYHLCLTSRVDAIKCWGLNKEGQTDIPSVGGNGKEINVLSLNLGSFHTCLLVDNMNLVCYGYSFEK